MIVVQYCWFSLFKNFPERDLKSEKKTNKNYVTLVESTQSSPNAIFIPLLHEVGDTQWPFLSF